MKCRLTPLVLDARHRFCRKVKNDSVRCSRARKLRPTVCQACGLRDQDGASLAYVKEQLGHSTIAVTVDLYGHLVLSANIAFVDRLDAKTSPQQNATQAQPADERERSEYSEVFENYGGPGQSRTADQRFRKPLLYPSELQGHETNPIISHQFSVDGTTQESRFMCPLSVPKRFSF